MATTETDTISQHLKLCLLKQNPVKMAPKFITLVRRAKQKLAILQFITFRDMASLRTQDFTTTAVITAIKPSKTSCITSEGKK